MIPISKAKIKFVHALQQKKYRIKYQSYILEGRKACETVVRAGFPPSMIIIREDAIGTANLSAGEIYIADAGTMKSLSAMKNPVDVLCVFPFSDQSSISDIRKDESLLMLDRIQDPGNLGTIIRTADWFGIKTIVLNKGCCDVHNHKVLQAAMGSHVNLRYVYAELSDVKRSRPGLKVLALDMHGQSLSDYASTENPDQFLLLVGNEGRGLTDDLRGQADTVISIPGAPDRIAESLNAAVSVAIALDRLLT